MHEQIEKLFEMREPLIKERNRILDNVFKYFHPIYQSKLKNIDAKIDEIDLQIYSFQKALNPPIKEELIEERQKIFAEKFAKHLKNTPKEFEEFFKNNMFELLA